mmetsp:Transcript_55666/g.180671  ORF Transcript_55666/g.180671 Transcript_55666/m.180671 type:complete len:305 (-) Transcript_55666:767-1681(-)
MKSVPDLLVLGGLLVHILDQTRDAQSPALADELVHVCTEVRQPRLHDVHNHLQETLLGHREVQRRAHTGVEPVHRAVARRGAASLLGPSRFGGLPIGLDGRLRIAVAGDDVHQGLVATSSVQKHQLQQARRLLIRLLNQQSGRPARHHCVERNAITRLINTRLTKEHVGWVTSPHHRLHWQAIRVAQQQVQHQQAPELVRGGGEPLRGPSTFLRLEVGPRDKLQQQQGLLPPHDLAELRTKSFRSCRQSLPLLRIVCLEKYSGHRSFDLQMPCKLGRHLLRLEHVPRIAELDHHSLFSAFSSRG